MEKSLLQAFKDAGISRLNTQSLAEFQAEYRKLTDDDKRWFCERFNVEFGWSVSFSQK